MGSVEWSDLEIGHNAFKELVQFWRDECDWKNYECFLNTFHHFKTTIQVPGFEALGIHFLHHRSSRPDARPLLFLHGWPGSFLEVLKILPLLTEPEEGKQAFHVVAPSLPGYGISGFSEKKGFGIDQHAICFAMLMERLGYNGYAIHMNMILALPPDPKKSPQKFVRFQNKDYDERGLKNMRRINWLAEHEVGLCPNTSGLSLCCVDIPFTSSRGYQIVQETKCVTLGNGLHDSPVAILAWFVGKLKAWTDDYPRTKEELINWTFMHYQGSPSAAMHIYKEALAVVNDDLDSMAKRYVSQPVGGSVFP
ncbi:epoxide hydrolase [Verticillium alfalfae VaMs.102]|uniref:Epoxide hydrolase n=1 Tax=Verticillium alfalfae (strain VaMs.102 / ATCC MYA-4576 / FGSC 10136) TaxID=526221 RepID=C9S5K3_VERA1|nr:epoxide hydrolase [Verticillium alfalfae VaMs.102]EEY15067.1 epoxide hydrolase [Verticillium alfalfae VaMs.102]